MAAQTKNKQTAKEITPLVDLRKHPGQTLTADDVKLLDQLQAAKDKVKALSDRLKPRIEATCRYFGAGIVAIGNHQVKLTESTRLTYSWKGIVYAVAAPEKIDAVKADFGLESTSYTAKMVS